MLKKLSAIILTALLAASLTACGTSAPASSSSTASSDSTAIVTAAYTEGDLTQATDTSGSTDLTLSDGKTLTITAAGVYTVSGNAKNASVIVEAGKEDKVQIILNGVNITNDSTPAVYVKSADEVVVTTAAGTTNTLAVTTSRSRAAPSRSTAPPTRSKRTTTSRSPTAPSPSSLRRTVSTPRTTRTTRRAASPSTAAR